MLDLNLNSYEVLCYKVCPELHDGPFYLLRLPDSLPPPFEVGAYADLSYLTSSPSIRQHLIEKNCWRGPGPAIVFCAAHPTLGIAIHELAHVLPLLETYPQDAEPSPSAVDLESRASALWASGEVLPIDPSEPWRGHEALWIRFTLHLWWRATNRFGYHIHPAELCVAGPTYGLSHGREYLEALADEPRRLADAGFAEIATTPAPQEFLDLFDRDVQRWRRENPSRNKD